MTTSADLAALTDQLYNRYVPLSDVTSSLKVLGIGSVNDLLARIKKETGPGRHKSLFATPGRGHLKFFCSSP